MKKVSKNRARRLARESRLRQHELAKQKKEYDRLLNRTLSGKPCSTIEKTNTKVSNIIASGVYHRKTVDIPSFNSNNKINGTFKENQKYTGNLVIGISTTHKSNLIPIISKEQATEVAKMRRG